MTDLDVTGYSKRRNNYYDTTVEPARFRWGDWEKVVLSLALIEYDWIPPKHLRVALVAPQQAPYLNIIDPSDDACQGHRRQQPVPT